MRCLFRVSLSYCLRLLISFDAVEVDHGGRLPAMGGVRSLVVVEVIQLPMTVTSSTDTSSTLVLCNITILAHRDAVSG